MDSMLSGLFGGQDDDDDDRRRSRAQDFVSRYEQGSPYEGFSDQEAIHNYQQVAGRMSPQDFEESAAEAFQRMDPQERMQYAQMMQQQGGMQFSGGQMDDPRQLARMTSQFHQQSPDGLTGLFGGGGGGGGLGAMLGGGGGGAMGSLLGGAMGGGNRGGGGGDMLNNPLAKAALGGIAAMAMKRMMGGR
ncbi:MAG: hypothetical protein AVDCRST_MAG49-2387 [uncultured Thermomicrobiales bacterium]|uniref:Uncharacterized protein n=1 Tax=uncultured Thermomicrobiales bacterium TaxID=1645740 RepID=A0A6J4UVC1_9BACT|nr:MAG: hypothetical protein AVDCRST_MAG49-2387 [uncultured Thermomicrobiales bacterium]